MKDQFAIQISPFVNDKTGKNPKYTEFLESLNARQIRIAGAYVDVETAYLVCDSDKGFTAIAKEYCERGRVMLPNSEMGLDNRYGVTYLELYAFMDSLTDEQEAALLDRAKIAAHDKGYVVFDYSPEINELKAG